LVCFYHNAKKKIVLDFWKQENLFGLLLFQCNMDILGPAGVEHELIVHTRVLLGISTKISFFCKK